MARHQASYVLMLFTSQPIEITPPFRPHICDSMSENRSGHQSEPDVYDAASGLKVYDAPCIHFSALPSDGQGRGDVRRTDASGPSRGQQGSNFLIETDRWDEQTAARRPARHHHDLQASPHQQGLPVLCLHHWLPLPPGAAVPAQDVPL